MSEAEAREFIVRLGEMWLSADPEQYTALCRADVLLVQPLLPPIRGREEARRRFGRLFAQVPDLRVHLIRWGLAHDSLLVEYVASGTVGGRSIEWRGADRIAVRDGLIAHRVAYFDWVPIMAQVLARPRAWLPALRAGLRPRPLRVSREAPH